MHITCRYLDTHRDQCTAEAVDPGADILLCTAHLARAWRLITDHFKEVPDARLDERTAA